MIFQPESTIDNQTKPETTINNQDLDLETKETGYMLPSDKYATRLAKRFAVFTFLSLRSPCIALGTGIDLRFGGYRTTLAMASLGIARPFTFNRRRLDDPRLLGVRFC